MTNSTYTPQVPLASATSQRSRAIVIGGSMTGLLAARVLADHFSEILLLDRDQFPDGPAPRKGVPQARHVHLLLVKGRMILEWLFPELATDLLAAGAVPPLDLAADMAWLSPVGWGPRFASVMTTFFCSRDLLESIVRARVQAMTNVRLISNCEVKELLIATPGGAVSGVRVRQRDAPAARYTGWCAFPYRRPALVSHTVWHRARLSTHR
jgi:2-polyprenyl-6-methoxyphenol hydroxylase-like FAD-dependent oxidoreductase